MNLDVNPEWLRQMAEKEDGRIVSVGGLAARARQPCMFVEELVAKLKQLANYDPEVAHLKADELLLAFINDDRVTEAFKEIERWYA